VSISRASSVADEVLGEYGDVLVRSFVMTLADRKARESLQEITGAVQA
jgi:hypothetical protein